MGVQNGLDVQISFQKYFAPHKYVKESCLIYGQKRTDKFMQTPGYRLPILVTIRTVGQN